MEEKSSNQNAQIQRFFRFRQLIISEIRYIQTVPTVNIFYDQIIANLP